MSNSNRDNSKSGTTSSVNSMRSRHGLTLLKPAFRKCLKCSTEFKSKDISNRLCWSCSNHNDYSSIRAEK